MAKYVGAHVSAAGGVENAPLNAAAIGANAFALFTKNQRQWVAKPLSERSIAAFRANLERVGIRPVHVLPHDSYLINLGHPEPEGLAKSRAAFVDEMQRCAQLGLRYLNFHPGAHLGKISETECLARVAESIDLALDAVPEVVAVIDATPSQGRRERMLRLLAGTAAVVGPAVDWPLVPHSYRVARTLAVQEAAGRTAEPAQGEDDDGAPSPILAADHLARVVLGAEPRVVTQLAERVLAPLDEVFEKTASNLQEVAARGGPVIMIAPEAAPDPHGAGIRRIHAPDCHPLIAPLVYAVPVQLLAMPLLTDAREHLAALQRLMALLQDEQAVAALLEAEDAETLRARAEALLGRAEDEEELA